MHEWKLWTLPRLLEIRRFLYLWNKESCMKISEFNADYCDCLNEEDHNTYYDFVDCFWSTVVEIDYKEVWIIWQTLNLGYPREKHRNTNLCRYFFQPFPPDIWWLSGNFWVAPWNLSFISGTWSYRWYYFQNSVMLIWLENYKDGNS